jgi:IS30 family transposase
MGYPTPHLTRPEQIAIRKLAHAGIGIEALSDAFGRAQETISRHTGNVLSMRARAERIEKLFASCNRALAGGR